MTPTSFTQLFKLVGVNLPDAYAPDGILQVGELDEFETFFETFVGQRKHKVWIGMPGDHFRMHRKTLCYSKSLEILNYSGPKILINYLKFGDIPVLE